MFQLFDRKIDKNEIKKLDNEINRISNNLSRILQVKNNCFNHFTKDNFKDKWGVPYHFDYFSEEELSGLKICSFDEWEETKMKFSETELIGFENWKKERVKKELQDTIEEIISIESQIEVFSYLSKHLNQLMIKERYNYIDFPLDRYFDYIEE